MKPKPVFQVVDTDPSLQPGDRVQVLPTDHIKSWPTGYRAIGYQFIIDDIPDSMLIPFNEKNRVTAVDRINKYGINYKRSDLLLIERSHAVETKHIGFTMLESEFEEYDGKPAPESRHIFTKKDIVKIKDTENVRKFMRGDRAVGQLMTLQFEPDHFFEKLNKGMQVPTMSNVWGINFLHSDFELLDKIRDDFAPAKIDRTAVHYDPDTEFEIKSKETESCKLVGWEIEEKKPALTLLEEEELHITIKPIIHSKTKKLQLWQS